MIPDSILAALRAGLEAWERDAAAQWDAFIRSPQTLHRLGEQIRLTLETQQRIQDQWAKIANHPDAQPGEMMARLEYHLERLAHQIAFLSERIAHIERTMHHD